MVTDENDGRNVIKSLESLNSFYPRSFEDLNVKSYLRCINAVLSVLCFSVGGWQCPTVPLHDGRYNIPAGKHGYLYVGAEPCGWSRDEASLQDPLYR